VSKKILNILIVSAMNDNENNYEWISRYHEGDLNKDEMDEIRSDPELDKQLTEFLQDRDLIEFLKILDKVRGGRRERFGLNCMLIAALLLALVVFGGFWLYQNPLGKHLMLKNSVARTYENQKSNAENKESVFPRNALGFPVVPFRRDNLSRDLLAANFQPLEYMEGMIGFAGRSGNFVLLAPASQITILPGDTLRFRWEEDMEGRLAFFVMNDRGECVVSLDSVSHNPLTVPTTSWTDGLYYWKFILQDDLVNVGKIIIRDESGQVSY